MIPTLLSLAALVIAAAAWLRADDARESAEDATYRRDEACWGPDADEAVAYVVAGGRAS